MFVHRKGPTASDLLICVSLGLRIFGVGLIFCSFVIYDEDEADVNVEFASGGDVEKVFASQSSCTPTSKENGSTKETPKSSKTVRAFLYLVVITDLYTPTE